MGLYDYYTGPTPEDLARLRAAGLRGSPMAPADAAAPQMAATPLAGGASASWGPPAALPGTSAQQAPPPVQPPLPVPPPPQPRALPKASGPVRTDTTSTTSTPTTPPPEPTATQAPPQESASGVLEHRADDLNKQLTGLEGPTDYSGMKEEMGRRQQAGGGALIMALAAQNAGKGFEPFSATYLKKAADLQGNMPVEGGYISPQGEAVIDPGYKKIQQIQYMQRRLAALDTAIANARTREERIAYQQQRDKENDQFRTAQMQMQREFHGMTATIAQQGLDLRRDIARGQGLLGGEGGGAIDALPKVATQQEKQQYGHAAEVVNILPGLIDEVTKNPKAFGMGIGTAEKAAGAVGAAPSSLSWVPGVPKLNQAEQTVRGRVYMRFAGIMHDLIGSAQTPQEAARLQAFIPQQGEDVGSITRKMHGALTESQAIRGNLRQRYGMQSQTPAGTRENPIASDL